MRLLSLALLLSLAAAVSAAPVDDAIKLYKDKRYPEAREALEKITNTDPNNAAACYYLGMTLVHRGDSKAMEDALPWLEKAVKLEPDNATYLSDYGGISMSYAGKSRSISAATKGRDAMEKSLTIDPNNIEARVGLMEFYTQAPWPLGSSAKAAAQLEEIRKRDPKRAVMVSLNAKMFEKKYDEAFKLCDEMLAKTPDDFFALFQYSRVALASGRNLEAGLACLKKYLELAAKAPGDAKPAVAWLRTGDIQQKLGHPDEARAAYKTVLELEPGNKAATAALANLK